MFLKNRKLAKNITPSSLGLSPVAAPKKVMIYEHLTPKKQDLFFGDSQLQTKKYLDKLHGLYDLDIFSLNTKQSSDINPDLQCLDKLQSN